MKITNITEGPRGLNVGKEGDTKVVWVEAGQTVDVELNDSEAISAQNTGWFTGVEGPKKGKDRSDLEAQAKELGIEVDARWGDARLQKEIDAKLATE